MVNGKLFTTDENGVVLSKKTMKNGWTSYEGNSYYYQDGTAYTGFSWCTTMLAMAGWFETKLWNGRIIKYYIRIRWKISFQYLV